MQDLVKRHSLFWKDKDVLKHTLLSITMLTAGLVLTYASRLYANGHSTTVVSDLLLDNLPVLNVGFVFFQGAFIFVLVAITILLWEPMFIPFTLEVSALFFLVRSMFMVLTHLAAPSAVHYEYIEHSHNLAETVFTLSSGNDLFFSGHTGYPFLFALIFWYYKKPSFKYFFLLSSIVGAVAVILGHLHYSIDVFSAYFITFGIFEIAKVLFKKEYLYLHTSSR